MMNKFTIALITCVLLFAACNDPGKTNEQKLKEWVKDSKKPIIVSGKYINAWNSEYDYTLIDAEGNIYTTGSVRMVLPDTLKPPKEEVSDE